MTINTIAPVGASSSHLGAVGHYIQSAALKTKDFAIFLFYKIGEYAVVALKIAESGLRKSYGFVAHHGNNIFKGATKYLSIFFKNVGNIAWQGMLGAKQFIASQPYVIPTLVVGAGLGIAIYSAINHRYNAQAPVVVSSSASANSGSAASSSASPSSSSASVGSPSSDSAPASGLPASSSALASSAPASGASSSSASASSSSVGSPSSASAVAVASAPAVAVASAPAVAVASAPAVAAASAPAVASVPATAAHA